jgi:hypothetical protein
VALAGHEVVRPDRPGLAAVDHVRPLRRCERVGERALDDRLGIGVDVVDVDPPQDLGVQLVRGQAAQARERRGHRPHAAQRARWASQARAAPTRSMATRNVCVS